MEEKTNKIITECKNKALWALGISYIYAQRYKSLKSWTKASRISGILIPAAVGTIFMTYNNNPDLLLLLLKFASPLVILQFCLSVYMTVSGNEDDLVKFVELSTKNRLLSEEYEKISNYPPPLDELQKEFDKLNIKESILKEDDEKNRISEKEKRKGHRFGHIHFRRICVECGKMPNNMIPTNCTVCGNF